MQNIYISEVERPSTMNGDIDIEKIRVRILCLRENAKILRVSDGNVMDSMETKLIQN